MPFVGLPVNTLLCGSIVIAGFMQFLPAMHTILIKGGVGRNGSTVAVSMRYYYWGKAKVVLLVPYSGFEIKYFTNCKIG